MVSVAAITALALVGVGILAVQANGSAPKVASAKSVEQPHPPATNPSGQPAPPVDPNAIPANSGTGKRIVYSLKASQIWLVGATQQAERIARVVPCTVPLAKGDYAVSKWYNTRKGRDGISVQYVVLWGDASDPTKYGFDAVASVKGMPPAPTSTTGGVRMTQDDALAVWTFATAGAAGTPVVVVD
jgi:hypothetical protein